MEYLLADRKFRNRFVLLARRFVFHRTCFQLRFRRQDFIRSGILSQEDKQILCRVMFLQQFDARPRWKMRKEILSLLFLQTVIRKFC